MSESQLQSGRPQFCGWIGNLPHATLFENRAMWEACQLDGRTDFETGRTDRGKGIHSGERNQRTHAKNGPAHRYCSKEAKDSVSHRKPVWRQLRHWPERQAAATLKTSAWPAAKAGSRAALQALLTDRVCHFPAHRHARMEPQEGKHVPHPSGKFAVCR